MARPSPTWERMATTEDSMTEAMVQSPAQPQTSWTNRLRRSWPHGVCWTSGWNCTAKRPASGASKAATGASGDEAVTVAPAGGSVMASKWLIHTGWVPVPASTSRVPGSATARSVRPYSPRSLRPTVPPLCWAMSWAP